MTCDNIMTSLNETDRAISTQSKRGGVITGAACCNYGLCRVEIKRSAMDGKIQPEKTVITGNCHITGRQPELPE